MNYGLTIGIIPIAEPEFTNSRACRIPPLPALSPLIKGGEGRGEGGFEADGFINFGSAIGITIASLLQVPPASRGEPRGARGFGSPCKQGEP